MKKNVVEAKLRVYKKHMACAEKEVIWYRDEIARLEALLQERNLTPVAADGAFWHCKNCGYAESSVRENCTRCNTPRR